MNNKQLQSEWSLAYTLNRPIGSPRLQASSQPFDVGIRQYNVKDALLCTRKIPLQRAAPFHTALQQTLCQACTLATVFKEPLLNWIVSSPHGLHTRSMSHGVPLKLGPEVLTSQNYPHLPQPSCTALHALILLDETLLR